MKRSPSAIRNSSLVDGGGLLSTTGGFVFNGIQDLPDSIETKSLGQRLAAVHAGCLSIMLSDALAQGGGPPKKLKMAANLVLDNLSVHGWSITSSHLVFTGKFFDAKSAAIEEIVADGQDDSPLSRSFD